MNQQKAAEYAAKIISDYQLSSPDLHTALTNAVLYGVKLEQGEAVWVNESEIPLDIEQAASKWADSQYPDEAESDLWLAARNGYRRCWRDLQTPKDDWRGLQGTNTD